MIFNIDINKTLLKGDFFFTEEIIKIVCLFVAIMDAVTF